MEARRDAGGAVVRVNFTYFSVLPSDQKSSPPFIPTPSLHSFLSSLLIASSDVHDPFKSLTPSRRLYSTMTRGYFIPGLVFVTCAMVLSVIVSISLPFLTALDIVRIKFDTAPQTAGAGISELRVSEPFAFCSVMIVVC